MTGDYASTSERTRSTALERSRTYLRPSGVGTIVRSFTSHAVGPAPVTSDESRKRRVEQVTGLPFAFELAVA